MLNMTCFEDFQMNFANPAFYSLQTLQPEDMLVLRNHPGHPAHLSSQLVLPDFHQTAAAASGQLSAAANGQLSAANLQSQAAANGQPTSTTFLTNGLATFSPAAVSMGAACQTSGAAALNLSAQQQAVMVSKASPSKLAAPGTNLQEYFVAKKLPVAFKACSKSAKYTPKPFPTELGNLKTYSNPDILICGNCKELFNDLVDMLDHKKNYCKMRFTCKCHGQIPCGHSSPVAAVAGGGQIAPPAGKNTSSAFSPVSNNNGSNNTASSLECKEKIGQGSTSTSNTTCKGKQVYLKCTKCTNVFESAWDLISHGQSEHSLNIFTCSSSSNQGGNMHRKQNS